MSSLQLNVPALRVDRRGDVHVTRWGEVGGFTFRAGDRVVVGDERPGGLLLLRPRGYGWPMLGRRAAGRLLAEPGGVPAAERRWRVAGGVVAVERDLERAVTDGGVWHVAVRLRQVATREPVDLAALPAAVGARFAGGRLTSGELEALCLRAALAPEQFGLDLAVGASAVEGLAGELAGSASFGTIALDVRGGVREQGGGRVIIGPWAEVAPLGSSAPVAAAGSASSQTLQLGLFDRAGVTELAPADRPSRENEDAPILRRTS